MKLKGVGVVLAAGERLEFRWEDGGSLSLAPEACLSVHTRAFGQGGGLRLVFRFRPTEPDPDGGGDIAVGMVVAPEEADAAWQFVQVLIGVYGVEDVAWTDGRKVVPERSFRVPADGTDWLNAPASPRTEALLTWVTRRLVADSGV